MIDTGPEVASAGADDSQLSVEAAREKARESLKRYAMGATPWAGGLLLTKQYPEALDRLIRLERAEATLEAVNSTPYAAYGSEAPKRRAKEADLAAIIKEIADA